MQVEVLVAAPAVNQFFSYESLEPLEIGQIISVPFRKKKLPAIVTAIETEKFKGAIKPIDSIFPFRLTEGFLQFIIQMAHYTLTPLGQVAKMVLPFAADQWEKVTNQKIPDEGLFQTQNTLSLSGEQKAAFEKIQTKHNQFQTFLLDGVTGSGKTAVYMEAIRTHLESGKQALVLLPEIALTNQLMERFDDFFQHKADVWHSGVSTKNKRITWKKAITGAPMVVIGARSALFLPFQKLSLTVVDEEHDSSFKQEEQAIYNGRDMAVLRSKLEDKSIILASATPSVESVVNVQRGKYEHLILEDRFHGTERPQITLVDMRSEKRSGWISAPLQQALTETFNNQQQALLFLNRRGYAPISLCHYCGHRITCLGCSACLVHHKTKNKLECHHCGYGQPYPEKCPKCHQEGDFLVPCGPGVERVMEELMKKFPHIRAAVLTSDEAVSEKNIQEFIDSVKDHQVDCIIGTQILAKGHHFPKLNTVGVIDADMGLTGADIRASERTFQLLEQVSGRAGREHGQGQVFLQTYNPEHPLIQAIQTQDRQTFYSLEIEEREKALMPPFGRLAAVIVSCVKEHVAEQVAKDFRKKARNSSDIMVLGPVAAPLYKLRGRYRWRFLIQSQQTGKIQPFITQWIRSFKFPSSVRLHVDIDPYSFM